jgi:hypothetical protein
MNSPDITSAVLAEHRRDLRRQARGSALAALARCCTPSTWTSALRRTTRSFVRADRTAPCAG